MNAATETPEHRRAVTAPSMIQLGRRVLTVIGVTTLILLALWLWISWGNTKQSQLQRMSVAVKLLAAHADSSFASLQDDLATLGRELTQADVVARPAAALPLLQRFKAGNPDVGGVTLIAPDGRMLASTAQAPGEPLPNVLENPEWREDFLLTLDARGLTLNRPQFGFLLKQWLIPLRLAVRDERHRVLFVLQTSIPLDRQQVLWRSLPLQKDAAVGLLREDGYLISRLPHDLSGAAYQQQLTGALYHATRGGQPAGMYEGLVVADGSDRLGTYQRLERHSAYAFLSLPRSTFVVLWWEQVRLPLFLAVGAMGASVLAYAWIAMRFRRRMEHVGAALRRSTGSALPSSGVREIDTFVAALADTQEQLRTAARDRERQLLAAAQAGTYALREADGVVVAADATLCAMLGRSEAEMVGQPWASLLVDPAPPAGQEFGQHVQRFRHASGALRWLSVSEYVDRAQPAETLRIGLAIDVSDRERLLEAVRVQSRRMQALWQLATRRDKTEQQKIEQVLALGCETLVMETVLINELSTDRLIVNHAADTLALVAIGQVYPLTDTLCRLSLESRQSLYLADTGDDARVRHHPLVTEAGIRGFASIPIWVGEALYGTMVFMRRAPLPQGFSDDDRAFMELLASWFGQIVLQQRQRAELERQALTDSLTRLPNRRAAEARFAEEFARAKRAGEAFSIAICDLDRFKLINDLYGHDTGDHVLLQVAALMKAQSREGDWVARWGGEEFIVFLHRSGSEAAVTAMERLRLAIKEHPVATAYGALDITISIGIGTYRGSEELAAVISEADGCLYEAKKSGRDRVMVSATSRHTTLWKAGQLQQALREQRLVPAYQTIVDLATGAVVADEALARLIEPDGRVIPAGEFIEAAEGIHLIHVVDEVIARLSMERCVTHLMSGQVAPHVAHFINLSPQFLARRELVHGMLRAAEDYCRQCNVQFGDIKPVVFEITEREMIGNMEDLKRDLQPLLDFGFRLALDDFGSGYSSFLYLATLPVSFLKIEGWMVRNMRLNHKIHSMVQSIVVLARDQGITTIAECVEDGETAEVLRQMGVDWAQGYYFSRPEVDASALPARAGAGAIALSR